MLYRLIILNGDQKGERHSVGLGPLVIGSGSDCSLRLNGSDVAREHARIIVTDRGLFVKDLGTIIRILVNKHEVSEAVLKHGDVLEVGSTSILVEACLEADISEGQDSRLSRRGLPTRTWIGLLSVVAVLTWLVLRHGVSPSPSGSARDSSSEIQPALEPIPSIVVAAPIPEFPSDTKPEMMTEELRQLKQALSDLRETVHELIPVEPLPLEPKASAAPQVLQEPEPVVDPEKVLEEKEASAARIAIEAGRWEEAHARLDVMLANHPEDVTAFELRAIAYERQGLLEKAVGQWSRILMRSGGGTERLRAEGERERLTQEVLRTARPVPSFVRLGEITSHKFQSSDDYDEMRLLRVEVERIDATFPERTFLQVAFFDRSVVDGRIRLSQAIGSKDRIPVEVGENLESNRVVTTTYMVPRNGRKQSSSGPEESFYGYLIRLVVDNRVVDELARPESLLNASLPADASTSTGEGHL